MMYKISYLLLFLFSGIIMPAFPINISGVVIDNETNDPIPFVNIWIEGTSIGTTSNIDGKFSIKTDSVSVIKFSSVGYIAQSQAVNMENADREWEIRLSSDMKNIDEISVNPDFSYDEEMFKKVLSHKNENNDNIKAVKKFSNYDRTTVLLATSKEDKIQKLLKIPDSLTIKGKNGASYLPVYFAESLKNITQENDVDVDVVSNQKDGLLPNLNEQIESIVLNKIAIDFNFYKNQINVFDRGFISPISNVALLYYNIYLTDSTICDGIKHYKFSFYPKNKHAVVFTGSFWIEDESFALISIDATLSEKANINFIEDLNVSIDYEKRPDGTWFYKNQKMNVKFSLGKNTSFTVKDNQYGNIDKGEKLHINRSLQYLMPKDTVPSLDYMGDKNSFLNPYSEIEQQAKTGIEQLKQNPVIKSFDKIGDMLLSGYYTQGILEVGPIFDFYTTNKIEGQRFTLPVRTGQALFKNFTVGGYLGYGTKSKELKYGISAAYKLPVKTRTIISAQYSDDYALATQSQYTQFIQENPYNKGNGNFISALTSKHPNEFVFGQKRIDVKLETDLSKNIGLSVNPYYNRNYSSYFIRFKVKQAELNSFDNRGVLINFRFSFDRDFDEVYFARVYYGNTKPVINMSFDIGQIRDFGIATNSNKFYALSNVSIKHRFSIAQIYIRYMVNAGYMIGDVPYTLLDKPYGTNSLGYSRYSFNLLDYSSFAHNLYTNIHLNLNGGGILFNHVPLLSNLNLREIVSFKCHYGMQTKQLTNSIDIPVEFMNRQTKPYIELGVGVTNIFKALRIEYVHVLGDREAIGKYAAKHGIRMRFEVMF